MKESTTERQRTAAHPHTDRYAIHRHDLPESAAESVSRAVIRLVPLAYGLLLGGLIDSLALGLLAGAMLSAALDLSMRKQSLLRALARELTARLCPLLAAGAHALAAVTARVGVDRLGALHRVSCGAET